MRINKFKIYKDKLFILSALFIVFPVYINFFISREPLIQGVAYLTYLIPIIFYMFSNDIKIPIQISIYWFIFSALLFIPSIVNISSGKLESDLVDLNALFAKWVFLTSILLYFYKILTDDNKLKLTYLFNYLFLFLLPLLVLIFFNSLYLQWECPKFFCRVDPFSYGPFNTAEIFFMSILICLQIRQIPMKFIFITLSFITMFFLQSRIAILASIIAILIIYFLPIFVKFKLKIKVFTLLILIILSIFLLYFLVENTFIGRDLDSVSNRIHMWKLGINAVINNPIFGLGYGVNPDHYNYVEIYKNPYSFEIHHESNYIHNFFIRVAAENGLPFASYVFLSILLGAFFSFKNKNFIDLSIIISVSIFYFFSVRHFSINLLSIIWYLIILKSIIFNKSFSKTKI